eukprot:6166628-Prymnesium_polylepis.1
MRVLEYCNSPYSRGGRRRRGVLTTLYHLAAQAMVLGETALSLSRSAPSTSTSKTRRSVSNFCRSPPPAKHADPYQTLHSVHVRNLAASHDKTEFLIKRRGAHPRSGQRGDACISATLRLRPATAAPVSVPLLHAQRPAASQ